MNVMSDTHARLVASVALGGAMTPQQRYATRQSVLYRVIGAYADKRGLSKWSKSLLECDVQIAMAYGTPIIQAVRNIKRVVDQLARKSA